MQSQSIFLYCHPTGRCTELPFLSNVVAGAYTCDLGSSVKLTCVEGNHFPDGVKAKLAFCNLDGIWEGAEDGCLGKHHRELLLRKCCFQK